MIITTYSELETFAYACEFGKQLPPNSIVCFFGDLGAGKTTFIKGLTSGVANIVPEKVNSPTFVYLNIYEGEKTVYHFDLYRLRNHEEFISMGFDEMFYQGGICCIEWSEKISELLSSEVIKVTLEHLGKTERKIKIEM